MEVVQPAGMRPNTEEKIDSNLCNLESCDRMQTPNPGLGYHDPNPMIFEFTSEVVRDRDIRLTKDEEDLLIIPKVGLAGLNTMDEVGSSIQVVADVGSTDSSTRLTSTSTLKPSTWKKRVRNMGSRGD